MALSWNEIKQRASAFSKEWENEVSEDAEAKSFWDAFFNVFGISRRRVATFEQAVKKVDGQGFIDLLWKGVILVEHKSRGKDLERAYKQATDYFAGLKEADLPKYILVSDFARFRLYDLEEGVSDEFQLENLVDFIHLFGFIAGYEKRSYKDEDIVNIKAAEKMGRLHDALKEIGYNGHALEVYLVRLLFCLFADDTSIFEKGTFHEYIDIKTKEDGSDLAMHLDSLFSVLNTPQDRRLRNLDEHLAAFPYVNGKLFEERLPQAGFDTKMRQMLLDCCSLDWSQISPSIFGSMFQSVMNETTRRNLGAHYTSEKNILKLIKPLFLDALWEEFQNCKTDKRKLQQLHNRIANLTFLDPACGCGNFLIIAYKQLRLLEIEIVKQLLKNQQVFNIGDYFLLNVDKFYGIEFEEFPAQIAQVAMWLADHQMNMQASQQFGEYFVRLPLGKSATIVNGDALQVEWDSLQPDGQFDFILGNPPFLGHHYQNEEQKANMKAVFQSVNSYGVLDFVSAWYLKCAKYLQKYNVGITAQKTRCGFVSTNSISQGEQVGILWGELIHRYNVKIHFAHRTFKWGNEARNNAAVHVVIIGFSNFDLNAKTLYEYDDISGEPHAIVVSNINPYLVAGKDVIILNRTEPLCNVPKMIWGNKPTDGGNFLFEGKEEMEEFLKIEPAAKKWVRPYLGGGDFINGRVRYCLWLKDISPSELKSLKEVIKRIEKVKEFRLSSKAEATRRKANTPTLFSQISQPSGTYLAVPEVSSENRRYIPIAFLNADVIASNTIQLVPNASLWHFGLLTSTMHMTWVRYTCGRLKSDYRYSNSIVYNNYPFPHGVSDKQKENVEKAAQEVLDVRMLFPESSLADLYNPNLMPPTLVKAHQTLDKAVDLCYRPQLFTSEAKRIEFLFDLYDQYTNKLFATEQQPKDKKRSKNKVISNS